MARCQNFVQCVPKIFLLMTTLFAVYSHSVLTDDSIDAVNDCKSLLENFALSVGLFSFCAISHAQPIRLCEMCALQYINVSGSHEQILKLEDAGGKACQLKLINLDRLEIIESMFENVVDLWNRGRCDNCLEHKAGAPTTLPNNATKHFRLLGDRSAKCFELNNGSECEHCQAEYRDMNTAYESIKLASGDGDICIDLVDTMNSTRNKWSRKFGCTAKLRQPDLTFLLTAAGMAIASLLFYIGALFSKKRTPCETPAITDTRQIQEPGTSVLAT